MNGKRLAMAVAAVAVVAAGAGLAVYAGVGPFGPGDEERLTETPASTGTVYEAGDSGGGGTATATDEPPFTFAITGVEECGQTCRDVTVEFTNQQDRRADDVVVYTRVYAGNSTDESDEIWAGQESIGSVDAGETVTSTRRIELSYREAMAVQNNDGWITIVTTVETAETTVTFVREEQVA